MARYGRLIQIINLYVRLRQVKSSSNRLCHVRPCWNRFGQVKTGYALLEQFRTC
jgi:hypothetical protein